MKWLFLALGLLLAAPAWADMDNPKPGEDFKAAELAAAATSTHGWVRKLSFGFTGSFAQSSDVPGAPDGNTIQLGTIVDASMERTRRHWSWLNGLKLQYGLSRTPLLDRFIKSQDLLDAASVFFWRLDGKRLGLYGRGRATTSITSGYLVKPTDSTISRKHADATVTTEPLLAQAELPLTHAFEPLLFAEGVGLFVHPTESEAVTVRMRLGVGAQETYSQGGFVLADDSKTPAIEIKALRTAAQVGAEAEVSAEGRVDEHLSWRAKAGFFLPAWTSTTAFKSGFGALQSDLTAGASYKLAKALSIEWQSSFRKIPVVVDRWQIVNAVLLTAGLLL